MRLEVLNERAMRKLVQVFAIGSSPGISEDPGTSSAEFHKFSRGLLSLRFILEAPLVSRLHCRLAATSTDRLEVIDLDSTNGTFVNDERVFKGTASDGDTLRVGRVELTVSKEH